LVLVDKSEVTTGGALGWLKLDATAYDTVPFKRLEHVLREHWDGTPKSITAMAGTILINADMWEQEGFTDLVRANSDAELWP
jgi:hypothetical protein